MMGLLIACTPDSQDAGLKTVRGAIGGESDVLEAKVDADELGQEDVAAEEGDTGAPPKGDILLSTDIPGGAEKEVIGGDDVDVTEPEDVELADVSGEDASGGDVSGGDDADAAGKPAAGDGGTVGTIEDAIESEFDGKTGDALTQLDITVPPCESAADCDDGDPCNGAEACHPEKGCVGGAAPDCDDGDACNGVETCVTGTGCTSGEPPECDDGDPCNGLETCNPSSGCVAGSPLVCDDGNWCNGTETCEAMVGCQGGEPPTCDNQDECDGEETCSSELGECVDGTEKDCNDNKQCTADYCESPGTCKHDPILDKCKCTGAPVGVSYERSFELAEASVKCPLVGGSAGIKAELGFSGSKMPPHCANDCTGEISAGGELTGTINLCNEALVASGGASYTGSSQGCLECSPNNCQKSCGEDGGSCDTSQFSGNVSLTYSRFFGYQLKEKKGPVGLEVKCGATLSGTPSVTASGSNTTDNNACSDCTECLSGNASLGFGVAGSVGCYIAFDLWDGLYARSVGCKSCGSLGVDVWGGGGGQTGACGGGLCSHAGASVKAAANSPCVGLAIGWFGASVQCSASAKACAEASNCSSGSGNCANNGVSTSVSCNVSYSGECK